MKQRTLSRSFPNRAGGFSLSEVILAVGILSLSILSLLGLFGPTLNSVRDVVEVNEANGIRTTINSYIASHEIFQYAGPNSFDTLYPALAAGEVLYAWNTRENGDPAEPLSIVVSDREPTSTNIQELEGNIFVVVLSESETSDTRAVADLAGYPISVSIFAVAPSEFISGTFNLADTRNNSRPVLSFPDYILRVPQ
ncbi:MAG: hypothetical protein AAFX93_07830 [Verrucomicrobiota bacterium]